MQEDLILERVRKEREDLPRLGTRKLLINIKDDLKAMGISIGRDALFSLLEANNLLVRQKRSAIKTTDSKHHYRLYPNLIKHLRITAPNQLWVCDITYIRVGDGFVYLSLITDVYSHKIVGWDLSRNLLAENAIRALKMAIKQLPKNVKHNLIHHSDRGSQYCCNEYVKILKKKGITISMTENSDPLENAVAERANGILKNEWIDHKHLENFKMAKDYVMRIIYLYNFRRPHQSISNLTPEVVHSTGVQTKRMWKNYWKKRDNEAIVSNEEHLTI